LFYNETSHTTVSHLSPKPDLDQAHKLAWLAGFLDHPATATPADQRIDQQNKYKEQQFIRNVNSDGSKTAKKKL